MNDADLTTKNNDFDTLGGRLSRARYAKSSSLAEVAMIAGVETRTLKSWETDRSAPRSNRLAMLAGILGTSPAWLLFGRGKSPMQEASPPSAESVKNELDDLKILHQHLGGQIESVEESVRQIEFESVK